MSAYNPAFITVKAAADRLGVSTWAVYEWVANGTLPAQRIGNPRTGRIRLRPKDVDALIFDYQTGEPA
ncbi:helix-turn-helix domain-containing protein [Winkia sp. UMB3158]|uniref:Helix-turn-helix domain-containing protein n=1 Tax=Winkia neuii subsp. anitrata TaxID=29318 RepID=A0AB38XPP4_9ACTO|nr:MULTISPECIES: helix-turn-helix domain-containing protein [Winkia]MDK8340976.1 helix-turn-helix domain-containing protein [Winkia sp. UMB3164B]OFK00666.1 hypothetical protein HMPREF2835_02400 [Actinomyces sp. HMSC072A03]KWZ75460.1 DNA binding domain, excisionase family [Winkia neuii]MDK7149757.1 helix-turn-helix domain-containing protein [Winkia sp. UMB3158]MDK7163478.1 helix-turn-helix domain-containing protein [Winkia sp. UMB3105]